MGCKFCQAKQAYNIVLNEADSLERTLVQQNDEPEDLTGVASLRLTGRGDHAVLRRLETNVDHKLIRNRFTVVINCVISRVIFS